MVQLIEAPVLQAGRSRARFPMVIRIFQGHNPSGLTVALGSTQPPTEMSSRNISLGLKGGRCLRLTTFLSSIADFLEIWGRPQTPALLRASNSPVQRLLYSYSAVLECYLMSDKYFILCSNYICVHLY